MQSQHSRKPLRSRPKKIKADMEEKGVDEITAFGRIARWKEVISSRLDSKALKAALPDVYSQYMKPSSSRRFTVA